MDSSFDPVAYLEQAIGRPLDAEDVRRRRWQHKLSLLSTAGLRPGVDSYLSEARWLGLSTAIVTSDTETWVTDHLTRLQVTHSWDCVVCANGDAARAKPAPDLYLAALRRLGLAASEAIAFEDSPNGIRAAKAAGLVCVSTPKPRDGAAGPDRRRPRCRVARGPAAL